MERREYHLNVNGEPRRVRVRPDTPLLWSLRESLGLVGAKYGCGRGLCGACTVHVDGHAIRSCLLSTSEAEGHEIVTIEGLPHDHPVLRAWVDVQVPQCGYCQPGQIMSAVALLQEVSEPDDERIRNAMSGNICRCGTYLRILRAIRRASRLAFRSPV